jgi:hypothetical protein
MQCFCRRYAWGADRLGELLAREQSADQFERLVGSGDTALQLRVFDGVHSTSRTSRAHQRVGTVLQWARPFGYAKEKRISEN